MRNDESGGRPRALNHSITISTDDGEGRWVNLDLAQRISLARDTPNGQPVPAFTFDGAKRVTLHGTEDAQRTIIRGIAKRLDDIALPHQHYGA